MTNTGTVTKYFDYTKLDSPTKERYTETRIRQIIDGNNAENKKTLDNILEEVTQNFRNYHEDHDITFTRPEIEGLLEELRNTKKNKNARGWLLSPHYGGKRRTRKNKKSKKKLKKIYKNTKN